MKSEIKKWNPFADFGEFQNRFHNFLPSLWAGHNGNGNTSLIDTENWEPAVDIEETDKTFLITADLPDVKKKDIKVTINDGILTISGERNAEEETKEKTFHRIERFHGSYERSFSLPDNVAEDKMDAKLKDGSLKITLPKLALEKKKPTREIAVA